MAKQPNQVFLSYAHKDNEVPKIIGDRPGWVTCFEQFLELELSQSGVLDLEIWRDEDALERWRDLELSIESALSDCQIFIGIVSPVYVKQEWCWREIEFFSKKFGDGARIFKVEKRPVVLDEQPTALRRRPAIEMYRSNGIKDDIKEFYHPIQKAPSAEFVDEIRTLVVQMERSLKSEIKQPAEVEDGTASTGDETDPTIFLATPAPELRHLLRKVEGELDCLGLKSVSNAKDTMSFSIHMIGGEIDEKDAVDIICELEAAKSAALERVIWVPTHLRHNPEATELLDRLGSGELSEATDEFIEGSLSQLKSFLREMLPEPTDDTGSPDRDALSPDLTDALETMSSAQLIALRKALGVKSD